jgi:hypothetical protein
MIGPWLITPVMVALVEPVARAVSHLQGAGTRWALGWMATHDAQLLSHTAFPFVVAVLACALPVVAVRALLRARRTR